MENFYTTLLVAISGLFPGGIEQDHPHWDRDLLRIIIHTQPIYLHYLKIISISLLGSSLHLPSCPFVLLFRLPSAKKRPPEFNPDHPGCGWEACWGQLPAVGGSGGLGNRHLCDYPAGAVGPFLHPQDAAQPPAHVHLPVWIGKDAPGFVKDFFLIRIL